VTAMLADVRAAFAFLTILPVGYPEGRTPGAAFAYFPLVGLFLGGALWLVAALPWPTTDIAAFAVLLLWVVLTGGLHLDGFGDACDGLLATASPERRLEIMKDPRTGSWAVVGMVLLLLGKWVLLQVALPVWLVAPPVVGRWAMVLAAYSFPHARSAGLGVYFRKGLGQQQMIVASLITGVVMVLMGWWFNARLLLLLFVPLVTIFLLGRWAANRLGGGLTGDVYGAMGEVTELACLAALIMV
jgi:adenosylcobinamide-GDP ribazoletransferase